MNDSSNICLHCCLPKGRPGGCDICGGHAPGVEVEGHPMFLTPGTILREQYLIGRVLGFGGFGVTYLGLDLGLNMRVAIKEFLPTGENLAARHTDRLTVAPYPGKAKESFAYGLKKFIEEGRALARFTNHPNVVSVLSFFEAHGTAYLVMLFLEGMPLDDHLKKRGGRLNESESVQIITMVLDGLKVVHKQGLLHRDISPDNIFLASEGQVQLIDFGSARAAIGRQSTNISKIVKAGYSPLEQYRTEALEGAFTDIYATGATLYRMVTGVQPPEAMDRIKDDPLVDPSEIPGVIVSKKMARLLMKALSMESDGRFQSAQDMLGAMWGADPLPDEAEIEESDSEVEERIQDDEIDIGEIEEETEIADDADVEEDSDEESEESESDSDFPPRPPEKKWKKKLFVGFLGLIALVCSAYFVWTTYEPKGPCGDLTTSGCVDFAGDQYENGEYEEALKLVYAAPYVYYTARDSYFLAADVGKEWPTKKTFGCWREEDCVSLAFWRFDRGTMDSFKGLNTLRRLCDEGNGGACHALGLVFWDRKKELDLARSAFKRANELGDLNGIGAYGMFLREVDKKVEEGMRLLKAACDRGNKAACEDRGCGLVEDKQFDEAKKMFEMSCDGGHFQGCMWLADLTKKRDGWIPAKPIFRKACKRGESSSCNHFAYGVEHEEKDWAAAKPYYRKACDGGTSNGCHNLALGIENKEKDWAGARPFYAKACDGGEMAGCNALAYGIEFEEKDWAAAKPYYKKACDGGDMSGCNNLGYGLRHDESNWAAAKPFLEKACNGGNASGCRNYAAGLLKEENDWQAAKPVFKKTCDDGDMHYCNEFAFNLRKRESNWPLARKYYEKACGGGKMLSCFNVGIVLKQKGEDLGEARRFLKRACDGGYEDACEHI
jgi:serine/threonine protein kinase/TPR repeat protein